MQAASVVTSAAVNTVGAVGRAVVGTSNVVNRTVREIPAAMMYGPGPSRRIVVPLNNTNRSNRSTRRVSTPRNRAPDVAAVRRPAPPKPAAPKKSKSSNDGRKASADTYLEVMPPELLDRLTQDQRTLQGLVQAEALASDDSETVFWELEGRAGTSTAEAEHRMGTFTCRVLVESLKFGETATESRATACRTDETAWTLSF